MRVHAYLCPNTAASQRGKRTALDLPVSPAEKKEEKPLKGAHLSALVYSKSILNSSARAVKDIIAHYLVLCFCAGDLWLQSVPLEAGFSCCRGVVYWWLPPPPPLLDACVACESNMQKDDA